MKERIARVVVRPTITTPVLCPVGSTAAPVPWQPGIRNLERRVVSRLDTSARPSCTSAWCPFSNLRRMMTTPSQSSLKHNTRIDRQWFNQGRAALKDGRMETRLEESQTERPNDAKKDEKEKLLRELEQPDGGDPVSKQTSAESMTNGKLVSTPSRLFKLIIPLTTVIHSGNQKDIEPIALLVHPQQPLSYLETLIQSELPPIKGENGHLRAPAVSFIALNLHDSTVKPKRRVYRVTQEMPDEKERDGSNPPVEKRRRSREEDAETYAYPTSSEGGNKTSNDRREFVRWSQATEVGDFIRDAARAREFIISIEGAPTGLGQIRISVPSFDERTYFLRMRLRKISRRLKSLADIKEDCDVLAHRGAQRVALGGFGVLAFWWYLVYKLTFETELGWDTMEPVTYLVSLTTLMGGYLWFLYHNREISYRSALNITISARQKKLYQMKGVDLNLWASLIDEGNTLRREIKSIAAEYDVDWDEGADEQDKRVTEALKKERRQRKQEKDDADESTEQRN